MNIAQYGRCFIDGRFRTTTDRTFVLHNPANGSLLAANVQEAGPSEVNEAVAAAQKAFPAWSAAPPSLRAARLRKLAQLFRDNAADIAKLDTVAMGMPSAAAVRGVGIGASKLDHAADLAETYLGGTASTSTPGFLNMGLKVPFGVTAGICPWNAPVAMFASKAGPALAAGNCMIIKSSEKSPLSAGLMAQLSLEAGFPQGVLQVLPGQGFTGNLLAEHMHIRKISFTGSTRTGRLIQEASARSNLKNVVLELGGKSPAIVFPDADLDKAAEALAFSLWYNSGQICMATTRIYIHHSILEAFLPKYRSALQAVTVGEPSNPETMMGPLADKAQFDTIQTYLESTRTHDGLQAYMEARVLEQPGYYITPAIFSDVPDDAKINTEEIFGPVVVVHTFALEAEAIARANDTEYGLFASVFTSNIDIAIRCARALDAGNVAINCSSPLQASDMEFGGTKMSGIGREGGPRALEEWLETKSVYIKTGSV